jgi:tetratricopeptide (TPR) repeat protein
VSARSKTKRPVKAAPATATQDDEPISAPSASTAARAGKQMVAALICLGLTLAIWIVYGQTLGHDFINFDDGAYVYDNPAVRAGLSVSSIKWAFTHIHSGNWHPLTSLSHMLDCQLYGLNPAGHHFGNVLLHAVTAILLFLGLRGMTSQLWPSAFVATLFALHPLRVESVAWVSERKDVLSGLFFVLTMGAYVRYARQQAAMKVAGTLPVLPRWYASPAYWIALFFFALGLLSKPMLVTVPFVLLLLDFWPLGRWGFPLRPLPKNFPQLLLEKIPFVLLTLGSCVATVWAQQQALVSTVRLTLPWRIGNTVVAYATYLGQMIWPSDLIIFYPHPANRLTVLTIGFCLLLLIGLTIFAFAMRRRAPFLLMGWLWYLGMLVPVIGLVQVGSQAHADRYTYLPQIGLYIMVTFGLLHFFTASRGRDQRLGLAAAVILLAAGTSAYFQTRHWRDSVTLWTRAIHCTTGNFLAHYNLGTALAQRLKVDDAIQQYQRALQLRPDYREAHYILGAAFETKGQLPLAIQHYEMALKLDPNYVDAYVHLGTAMATQNRLDEAIYHYGRALNLQPENADAHYNLGVALTRQGKLDTAIEHYGKALQIQPDSADTHYNLGNALVRKGKPAEAVPHYEKALQTPRRKPETHYNLGNALAALDKLDAAIQHFRLAAQLRPDYAEAHNNLGILLTRQLKGDEARPHFQRALELAIAQSNPALADSIRLRLKSQKPAP